jgi:anti-sigma regulatory factor (Ser/Thr protein kinase)
MPNRPAERRHALSKPVPSKPVIVESATDAWCAEITGGVEAPCIVRELLTDRLGQAASAETLHDLHLLATELVTNAVLHAHVGGADTLELRVTASSGSVRVSVTDPGAETTPEVQELDPRTPGGMGLFLVEQISTRWGVERMPGGAQQVWFELAA